MVPFCTQSVSERAQQRGFTRDGSTGKRGQEDRYPHHSFPLTPSPFARGCRHPAGERTRSLSLFRRWDCCPDSLAGERSSRSRAGVAGPSRNPLAPTSTRSASTRYRRPTCRRRGGRTRNSVTAIAGGSNRRPAPGWRAAPGARIVGAPSPRMPARFPQ
jgi:hypothetical protein